MSNTLNSNGFDTGSNYSFGDKMIPPNFPRSRFDWSHLVSTTIDNAGLVVPLRVMETLPASDYEINVKSLVRVLPQVVPLYSRQRLYVYAFYSRCSDLWDGWQTFIRKGYSGNKIKRVPTLNSYNMTSTGFSNTNPEYPSNPPLGDLSQVCSLSNYFNIPIGSRTATNLGISALPYMMYMRIWRDYFLNKNYLLSKQSDDSYDLDTLSECILPDDDSRFRLNDNGKINSFVDKNKDFYIDFYGKFNYGYNSAQDYLYIPSKGMSWIKSNDNTKDLFICGLFYHDYPDDYFTSALPWPQRGNTPTLDIDAISLSGLSIGLNSGANPSLFTGLRQNDYANWTGFLNFNDNDVSGLRLAHVGNVSDENLNSVKSQANNAFNRYLADYLNNCHISSTGSGSATLTIENLRDLAVQQTIAEKMARTDGSYGEFGLTFFGEVSKAAYDYRPLYIGGTYSNLAFTEVLQTSQTTDSSMLGQYAGHGIGVNNDGYIGRFHSDDFGYIMLLACIMPDVYYCQGLEKHWTRSLQEDFFLPERSQLGLQPIYNEQLYLQASTVVDSDNNPVNKGLFAWQDIYDEYRFKDNIITGKIADMSDSNRSFRPYTQARVFDSLPNWGEAFAVADDVRKDYLAAPSETAYSMQFDINMRVVQPLSYRARPASILNNQVG